VSAADDGRAAAAQAAAMDPETFMWIALETVALLGVALVAWTIVHFAAPRDEDDVPPHARH
jgi:hypothetical protein